MIKVETIQPHSLLHPQYVPVSTESCSRRYAVGGGIRNTPSSSGNCGSCGTVSLSAHNFRQPSTCKTTPTTFATDSMQNSTTASPRKDNRERLNGDQQYPIPAAEYQNAPIAAANRVAPPLVSAQPTKESGRVFVPPLQREPRRKANFVETLVDTAATVIETVWANHTVTTDRILPIRVYISETLRRSHSSYLTLQAALFYIFRIKNAILFRIAVKTELRFPPLMKFLTLIKISPPEQRTRQTAEGGCS